MIFEKISILVLLALTTIYASESANFYRAGDDRNCICYKRSGPQVIKVPEIIQPSHGLERLVIFLYRDVITNQINMYTPNLEKQKLMPDLPFENNDDLTTNSNDTINAIINRSPYKTYIQVNKDALNVIPIENNEIAVNHKLDFYVRPNNESQKINIQIKDGHQLYYININQTDDQERPYVIPDIESQKNNNELENNVPFNSININQINDKESTHIVLDIESQENNDQWKNNVPSNYITVNEIDNHQHVNIIPDIEYQEKKYKLIHNVPFDYIKYHKEITDKRNNIDVKPDIEPQESKKKLISHFPSDYIKYIKHIDHHRQNGGSIPEQLQVNPKYLQIIPPDLQAISKYPQIVPENPQDIPKYPHVIPSYPQQVQGQFSEWIIKQIETFNNHKNRGNVNIDWSTIGNSILRILYENGMYVTDKGILIDSYGTVLDIHALSLRPILIGSTVPLNNILQQRGALLSSHGRLPYIMAILLTSTHPFKVLGVLPLGETYLPSSTLGTVTNIWKSKPKIVVTKKSYEQVPNIQSIPNDFELKESSANGAIPDLEERYDVQTNNNSENDDEVPDNTNPEKSKNHNKKKQKKKNNKKHKNKHNTGRKNRQVYDENESNMSIQPSNYNNVNGNENSLGQFLPYQYFDKFSSRRGLIPEKFQVYDLYSKKLNIVDLSSLNQNKSDYNIGRLLLQNVAISDEPLDISSRNQDIPIDIIHNRNLKPGPGPLSNPMDISFGSKKIPLKASNIYTHNNIVTEYPNLVSTQSNGVPISSIVGRDNDFIESLKKLSLIDMSKKARLENLIDSYSNGKTPSGILSSQKVPCPVSPAQQDFSSRSGITIQEVVGNSNNDEKIFDSVVNSDDDYDDGDFRIIGGNAATGSGTPISNKGRSGYVF